MGDRGSVQVDKGGEKSVVLFRHWGGSKESMKKLVEDAWIEGVVKPDEYGSYLERYPSDIVALLTSIAVQEDGYSSYLGKNKDDGDNSDNGHFILYVSKDKWELKHGKKTITKLPEKKGKLTKISS